MERNKKHNEISKERGITLVALIITIIVMLILVAVTVTVVVQSNLIEVAETATTKYKNSQEDQIQSEDVTVTVGKHSSLDGYLQAVCEHDWDPEKETAATCTSQGEKKCRNCGATEVILPHSIEGNSGTCTVANCGKQIIKFTINGVPCIVDYRNGAATTWGDFIISPKGSIYPADIKENLHAASVAEMQELGLSGALLVYYGDEFSLESILCIGGSEVTAGMNVVAGGAYTVEKF